MRFTSIDIQNYRQYHKLQLKFPQKSACDLHLVVADNGVGKTKIF
jgi:predicted ATPase